MTTSTSRLIGALLLSIVSAASSRAADYLISFSDVHTARVGQRVPIKLSTILQVRSTDEFRATANEVKVQYSGIEHTLALDEKGSASRLEYITEKSTRTTNGTDEELLEKGKVLVRENKDGEWSLRSTDGVLADDVRAALELVFPKSPKTKKAQSAAHPETSNDDDAIFGTRARIKVGATWAVDADGLAKEFAEGPFSIDPNDCHGTAKLVDVVNIAGSNYLNLRADFEINSVIGRVGQFPKGEHLKSGILKGTVWILRPIDLSHPIIAQAQSFHMDLKVVQDGGSSTLRTITSAADIRYGVPADDTLAVEQAEKTAGLSTPTARNGGPTQQ